MSPRLRAFRARMSAARAPPGSQARKDDHRLRPLIIAVLASPLPPGAARRIAEAVIAECRLRDAPMTHDARCLELALEGGHDGDAESCGVLAP